ncbi:homeobox protein vex1-like [Mixophyes fleayi]|uniref:homeobox protein vex1-like n=1 Tax=Mixophyes fleayi TaxID=3061075 RepID=UPI003F4E1527
MEKRSYTVEWLSESSRRNTTHPNVDLFRRRLGYSAFQYHNEHNILKSPAMDRPTSACNEKENQIDHAIALYQTSNTLQGAHDAATSRKAFKEVSASRPSPEQETCQNSSSDSLKSPGSLSEEETTSRSRTKFTDQQLLELEKSFKDHKYIGSSEKKRLSKVLKLSETQIKTWFQNRRMKFKRQSQDARVEAFFSGVYLPYYSYPDFQSPGSSLRPELAVPLTPPAPAHPFGPLHTTVVRPGLHAAPIPPPSLGSYPCPPMVVHPMLNEPVGRRYTPY